MKNTFISDDWREPAKYNKCIDHREISRRKIKDWFYIPFMMVC